jgi:4-hydroxy-3-methylbut-2-enyl diphosphate reductase
VKNLDKYVGQSIPLKVIEVDRERRKVVLSHKLAVDEEREKKRSETLETLAEGQERTGIVRRITDYGAFVDLGGIDGLLHISEMSWTRINHPSEVVKVGQKVQVVVQKMNLESGRVSLSMRQILPDPWKNVGSRYKVGDVIQCKISRLVPFGAFVLLEEGVEAIIPNQELTYRRIKRPEQVVSVGDEVEARVLDVRPEERRMTLSVRAVQQEREAEAQTQVTASERRHSAPVREAPRTTVADLLGDAFAQQREEFEREMKVKSKSRKKARDRAMEEAEEEAFGDLTDEELLDLAVEPGGPSDAGLEEVQEEPSAEEEAEAGESEEEESGS